MNKRPGPPDPSKYDMYAIFRTKERAEQHTQKKTDHSIYDVSALKQRQQAEAAKKRASASRASSAHASRPAPARRVPPQTEARQKRQTAAEAPSYGVRVRPPEGREERHHSSYITKDGRILDGFDKTGRPIYRTRNDAAGAIIENADGSLAAGVSAPVVHRYRITTLKDADTKPFPYGIFFTVLFCTVMVMGVLYSYMRLNEYTNELSLLNYRLGVLRADANTLSAEVVRREDLISIEQTASETLGMVKNDILTKKYVSIENEDKTELVSKKKKDEQIRSSVVIDLDTGHPIPEAVPEDGERETTAPDHS